MMETDLKGRPQTPELTSQWNPVFHRCTFIWLTEWVKWKSLSRVWLFVIPWTIHSPWNSPGQNTGWVAFPFSRGSSQPRDQTQVSQIAGGFFTSWAIYLTYKVCLSKCLCTEFSAVIQASMHAAYSFNFYNKQASSILVKMLGQPKVSNQTVLFILWPNCVTESKLTLLTTR